MRRMIAHMRTDKMMLFPEGHAVAMVACTMGKRTVGKLIYAARPVVIPAAIIGTERIHAPSQGALPWPCSRVRPLRKTCRFTALLCPSGHQERRAVAIMQEVMSAIASLLYHTSQPSRNKPCDAHASTLRRGQAMDLQPSNADALQSIAPVLAQALRQRGLGHLVLLGRIVRTLVHHRWAAAHGCDAA